MAFTKRGGRRRRRKTKRRKLSKQFRRKQLRRSRRGGLDLLSIPKYAASKLAQGAAGVRTAAERGVSAVQSKLFSQPYKHQRAYFKKTGIDKAVESGASAGRRHDEFETAEAPKAEADPPLSKKKRDTWYL